METNNITNMTLAEWVRLTGILPTYPTSEKLAVSVISQLGEKWDDKQSCAHRQLWRLSDYVVSSVSGIVIWLVPRI